MSDKGDDNSCRLHLATIVTLDILCIGKKSCQHNMIMLEKVTDDLYVALQYEL
jgi:hypothetical protein